MLKVYIREKAAAYAREWAHRRNPRYYDFSDIGGDCTNFVSQCIYAGGSRMNYKKTFGWYYINAYDRSPSWSGVEYFYNFIIDAYSDNGAPVARTGPVAEETSINNLLTGDIIQLSSDGIVFSHSLFVLNNGNSGIYVAAHSEDVYGKRLDNYYYEKARGLHIIGGYV